MDNVNCAINRFQEELGYDLKEKVRPHQPEQKGRKRFILLEKIASFSKDAIAKEKHLYEILHWLGEWGESVGFLWGLKTLHLISTCKEGWGRWPQTD